MASYWPVNPRPWLAVCSRVEISLSANSKPKGENRGQLLAIWHIAAAHTRRFSHTSCTYYFSVLHCLTEKYCSLLGSKAKKYTETSDTIESKRKQLLMTLSIRKEPWRGQWPIWCTNKTNWLVISLKCWPVIKFDWPTCWLVNVQANKKDKKLMQMSKVNTF